MQDNQSLEGTSTDIKQQQLSKLKELFPEAFTEGKVDWEKLKATLGEDVNFANERYVLNWAGKSDSFKAIQQPTTATLKPMPDESVNFDTSENIFIEGENLEVLKVLQKAYYGKVKCIIIDPPYNTGNDSFIYPDKFAERKEDYLRRIGDKDEEGFLMKEGLFRKNSKDGGQYHSNWLSMMYPRLFLAKNLLREDGVIFVFIDDNEAHNLRLLLNEILGEENFLADIIWEKRYTRSNDAKFFASVIDHVFVFRKSDALSSIKQPRTEKSDEIYKNPDNDPRGPWTSVSYVSQRTKAQRPNLSYSIRNPFSGVEIEHKTNAWKFSAEKNKEHIESNQLWWGNDGSYQIPRLKKFLTELPIGMVPTNLWKYQDAGTVDDGTKEVDNIIGKDIFDYPKPISVLKKILALATKGEGGEIVLDFFGGSGSTAHAVIDLNKEDGGNRKFILAQLPELIEDEAEAFKAGYKTIAEISKERIRRVIKKIGKEQAAKPGLFDSQTQDLGFKAFKLAPSNFKIWQGDAITEENLAEQLDAFTNPVKEGSLQQNMLYELMLKVGYELTANVQYVLNPTLRQDRLSHSGGGEGGGYCSINNNELIIALDHMDEQLAADIIAAGPQKVIALDNLFAGNDQLKTNTVLQMRDAGVDFRTI